MANGWVKSFQCKSNALDDVFFQPNRNPKHHPILSSSSCRKSVQGLKDVIETTKQKPKKNMKPPPPSSPPPRPPASMKSGSDSTPSGRIRPATSTRRHSRAPDTFFPALAELPEGHPSRNVVEIIFHTSWSPKAFSGRIEMVFKVQNIPRTVTRFEEYREVVKSRAASAGEAGSEGGSEDHARCVADGNEVMRFQCLGPTAGASGYDCGSAWAFNGGKGGIYTFSGSGGAHESAGGGKGRRAMLVCRVIAGRVCKRRGLNSLLEGRVGFNSVGGENGELLLFDSRAVLPCFFIIYKL